MHWNLLDTVLWSANDTDIAVLAVPVLQSCVGIWTRRNFSNGTLKVIKFASSHKCIARIIIYCAYWMQQIWRCTWPWRIFRIALHWQLLQSRFANGFLWCAPPRGPIERFGYCFGWCGGLLSYFWSIESSYTGERMANTNDLYSVYSIFISIFFFFFSFPIRWPTTVIQHGYWQLQHFAMYLAPVTYPNFSPNVKPFRTQCKPHLMTQPIHGVSKLNESKCMYFVMLVDVENAYRWIFNRTF